MPHFGPKYQTLWQEIKYINICPIFSLTHYKIITFSFKLKNYKIPTTKDHKSHSKASLQDKKKWVIEKIKNKQPRLLVRLFMWLFIWAIKLQISLKLIYPKTENLRLIRTSQGYAWLLVLILFTLCQFCILFGSLILSFF